VIAEEALEQLQRDVQYLMDRTAILDCVARHARGHDRHDADIITSTYHADGYDEHGYAVNAGPAYAQWANAIHGASSAVNQHHITTHVCEIDGDVAHCESYVMVGLLDSDEKRVRFLCGRYIDRLERREGSWKIAVRRSTVEVAFTADASLLHDQLFKAGGFPKGTRDTRDLSYLRPLTLEAEPPERW